MIEYTHTLKGRERTIRYAEDDHDLATFRAWLEEPRRALAFDTETTGLDWASPTFRLRLAQFGDLDTAWVIPVELGVRFEDAARYALKVAPALVCHNATFDLLIADRYLRGCPLERTMPKTTDTYVLAHLLDPRARQEGGTGHGLKALSEAFVDASAPDTTGGLTEVFRREYKATKATGWALIDRTHPTYVRYAGLDVLLTAELLEVLGPACLAEGWAPLIQFEHALMLVVAKMVRRGILVDVDYTTRLQAELAEESERWSAEAALYGVSSVHAPAQVAAALQALGETLTDKTDTGALSVAKEVLLPLADLGQDWKRIGAREPNPLAQAVLHAKRASKFAKSYAQAFLDLRDGADRLHANVNALKARTARMSIDTPPLQQLPSGDWKVRRCLVADPGQLIVAADYSQVEMRVLAALAKERRMLDAIASGEDLHDTTARLMFGEGFTKPQRKLAKNTGFGKVYGGGAKTLARQSGTTLEVAKAAVRMYDRTYPGIRRYSKGLQSKAQHSGRYVYTTSGRRLPLDGDRLYSATNYVIQSTARDVLGQALLELDAQGLGDYLLLPVHDEVVAQAPAAEAQDVVEAIGRTMTFEFYGVTLATDPEVCGPSWGHAKEYKMPEELR